MISRAVIEAVRDRADIVQIVGEVVTLKRSGNSWVGLCPFHQEKTPSFHVVPAKGIFHCFGCGEGGDVFKFIQKTRGMEFVDAVKELAPSCGVVVEDRELSPEERRRIQARTTLYDVCEKAAQHFHNLLLTRPEGQEARAYLKVRGLTQETIETFRLGFAPPSWDGLLNALHRQGISAELAVAAGLARPRERGRGAYDLFRGRVMVPIEDGRGRIVAFGGRILPGLDDPGAHGGLPAPKYVNSPETEIYRKSQVLYGLSQARAAVQRTGRLVVVEGYFDVISMHQAGYRETVAACGTALTDEHVRVIRPLAQRVFAVFDMDEAGLRAAVKSLGVFLEREIEPFRLDLTPAKDPDEFVLTQGAAALEARLAEAEPLFELLLARLVEQHGRTPGAMNRVIDDMAPAMRLLSPLELHRQAERLGRFYGLPDTAILERIGQVRRGASLATAEPARWIGNAELNHLLWLLIHHPEAVVPVLAEVDPEVVTDRTTARQAIGLLMAGQSFAQVLDEIPDPDLARVLTVAAAKSDLYPPEKAGSAAQQIVDRMRLNRIRAQLVALDREIATCSPAGDRSRYFSLLERRQSLQREKDALQRRPGRKVR